MKRTYTRKRKTEYDPNYSVAIKKAFRKLKKDKSIKNVYAQGEAIGLEVLKNIKKRLNDPIRTNTCLLRQDDRNNRFIHFKKLKNANPNRRKSYKH